MRVALMALKNLIAVRTSAGQVCPDFLGAAESTQGYHELYVRDSPCLLLTHPLVPLDPKPSCTFAHAHGFPHVAL